MIRLIVPTKYKSYSPSKMSNTIQDQNQIPYELFSTKDDTWFKNNQSHKMMRNKHNSGKYCSRCRNRNCYDADRIYGNKSLKKSKIIKYRQLKYTDKPAFLGTDFVYIRNGETKVEE